MSAGRAELAYEHNGQRISAGRFYEIACDPARSVAVEACAGAGKTWILVSRILRSLLAGAQPHEILAITFTRKAAGEMRQRLHGWLKEFARASPAELALALTERGAGPSPSQQECEALGNLYARLLEAGRPVQMRTFHSWFASLLRTAPLMVLEQMGLPANYQLLEDDSEAVAQVWRRFYAAVTADAEARRDYEACVHLHGRSQTQKALEVALAKRVEFTLADKHRVVERSIQHWTLYFAQFDGLIEPGDILAPGRAERTLLAAAAAVLGQASAPTFSAKGHELERALQSADVPVVISALLTKQGEARKFSDKLSGLALVREAQDLALCLAAACRQHEAWQHHQRMARLARLLIEQFSHLKRERGWVDMNDLETAAQVMLSDPVLSGWVQERLDARVQHLLIDEFQDTNPLQWQALHAWLAGYAGAGGSAGSAAGGTPSVFIVGDPKQSIYRFRRAEPQVFRAAQQFVVQGLGGDRLACDHTRRNAPQVLAAVNAVMTAAQQAGDYDGFREHTTASSDGGLVGRLPQIARETLVRAQSDPAAPWRDSLTVPRELPEERLTTIECRQAAAWVAQQLAAGARPRDFLVLARKRNRLSQMQDQLRLLGIAARQPEKADLCEQPEVQDVVALLDALVSTGHDLSLARALRSPLFDIGDGGLARIALRVRAARQQGRSPSWFELLQEPWEQPQLAALGPTLLRWKRWVDSLPPHDALAAIFHDGDVAARFAQAAPAALRSDVVSNLQAVLGTALAVDGARYATPYALVRALKAGGIKAPAAVGADAVSLLTVHGAKGLEAANVLLLDTDAAPARAETMGVLLDWPGEATAPRLFAFIASQTRPPPCCDVALASDLAARQREELNALYVAMTRARNRLVVSSVQPHQAAGASWWQRLAPFGSPLLAPTLLVASEMRALGLDDGVKLPVLPPLPERRPIQTQPAVAPVPATAQSRFGEAVHRLLEWSSGHRDDFGTGRLARIEREFELPRASVAEAAAMARRILGGQGRWAWEPGSVDWQGNEVELHHDGDLMRIDRLVRRRDTGHWWVLDYKAATRPQSQPDLLAQMHRYRQAVAAACPGATVHAAFLTGQGELVVIE